jgi:hypothetical protein
MKRCTHGRKIGLQPSGKVLQLGHWADLRLSEPAVKSVQVAATHQLEELVRQMTRCVDCRRDAAKRFNKALTLVRVSAPIEVY